MATITYTGILATNPSLDEVLDPNGTYITQTDTVFEIVNTTGGVWNGFILRIEGSYLKYGTSPLEWSGSVVGIKVLNAVRSTVINVSYDQYESVSFSPFWQSLSQNENSADIIDNLFSGPVSHRTQGSTGNDHVTTYGSYNASHSLFGGSGDDLLWYRKAGSAALVGGTGNDTIRVFEISSFYGVDVAGSAQNGDGGTGEINTLEIDGFSQLNSVTDIDKLTFVGDSKYIAVSAASVGQGLLSSNLIVTGSGSGTNSIIINDRNISGPVRLDLSGWTFSNWISPKTSYGETIPGIDVSLTGYNSPSAYNNLVIGTSVSDSISTGGGHDTIDAGAGDDVISGGQGDDRLSGGDGNDNISGGEGNNSISGGNGDDYLRAEAGNDTLTGGAGNDTLYGGSGDDTFSGGAGVDTIDGSGGNDTFIYAANEAGIGEEISGGWSEDSEAIDEIRLTGNNDFTATQIYRIERLTFAGATQATFGGDNVPYSWTVVGDNNQNEIVIAVSEYLNLASWTFENWSSSDKITIKGSGESDTFIAPATAASYFDGGAGYDWVHLSLGATTQGWSLDLSDTTTLQTAANGTSFKNVEALKGELGSGDDAVIGGTGLSETDPGDGDDALNLGGGNDYFHGRGGADFAEGGAGNDTLDGGAGDDELYGEAGVDVLYSRLGEGSARYGDYLDGGDGIDIAYIDRSDATGSLTFDVSNPRFSVRSSDGTTLINIEKLSATTGAGNDSLTGGALSDSLSGGAGRDLISGGEGGDTLTGGAGIDIIDGGRGNDTIHGGTEADLIDGGADSDLIYGDAGADNLDGGDGNDLLDGGSGYDVLSGGLGNDTLLGAGGIDRLDGGEGEDTAVFSGNRADYTVSETVEGLLVTHLPTKTLQVISDVEFYQFTSGALSRAQFLAPEPPVVVTPQPPVVVTPEPPVVTPRTAIDTRTSVTLPEGVWDVVATGTAHVTLTGNTLDNSLTGNVGKNTINAGFGNDKLAGGSGNDNLTGGKGKDAFVFDTKLGTSKTDRTVNFDTIKDFSVADDSLWLDNAVFRKLGSGSPTKPKQLSKNFFSLDKAKDKDDYLIYNKKTGVLSYDADGSGKGQSVEFAQLKKGLALKYTDFFVI